MHKWKRQGGAIYGEVVLPGDVPARVVVVDGPKNPKGAVVVVVNSKGGAATTRPLSEMLDELGPRQVIDTLCLQERVFGEHALPPVEIA